MLVASTVSTAKIWSAATGERTPRSGVLHAHGLYGEYCQDLEIHDTVTLAVQRSRCRAIFEFDASVPDA